MWIESDTKSIHSKIKTGERTEEKSSSYFDGPNKKNVINLSPNFESLKKKIRENTTTFLWNAKDAFGNTLCKLSVAKKNGFEKRCLTLSLLFRRRLGWDFMTLIDFEVGIYPRNWFELREPKF